jgi:hypothetical protein
MAREYLVYAIAVAIGFAVYLLLERVARLDFAFAMIGGFVSIHAAMMIGRHFLKR